MGSAALLALLGVWHTQSELHDFSCFGAVFSSPLGKHSRASANAYKGRDLQRGVSDCTVCRASMLVEAIMLGVQ